MNAINPELNTVLLNFLKVNKSINVGIRYIAIHFLIEIQWDKKNDPPYLINFFFMDRSILRTVKLCNSKWRWMHFAWKPYFIYISRFFYLLHLNLFPNSFAMCLIQIFVTGSSQIKLLGGPHKHKPICQNQAR